MNASQIILPLGLVAFMGLAFAGTSTNTGEGARIMFDKLDANDNGEISRREAGENDTVARHFDALDADDDGTLSRDELRKATSSSSSS